MSILSITVALYKLIRLSQDKTTRMAWPLATMYTLTRSPLAVLILYSTQPSTGLLLSKILVKTLSSQTGPWPTKSTQ